MSDKSYDKTPSLLKSKRYKSFIDDRDKRLEHILAKYKSAQDLVVLRLKELVIDASVSHSHFSKDLGLQNKALEIKLDGLFQLAIQSSFDLFTRMRKSAYVLSYAGEAEAMGQALQRTMQVSLPRHKLMGKVVDNHPLGGDLHATVAHAFNNLKRRVISTLELGLMYDESPQEIKDRIDRAFPKLKRSTTPQRQLRSIVREADFITNQLTDDADDEQKKEFTAGIIDSQDWEDMISDAEGSELPVNPFTRSEDVQRYKGEELEEWELENRINHDFVDTVRSGQSDAANENGITDMLWIAVSHKTLCEHCAWRDGLTSTQIEQQLEKEDDEIDAIVPPAHPLCYCRMAPVTKEIEDLSQELDDQYAKDFNEWLDDTQKK